MRREKWANDAAEMALLGRVLRSPTDFDVARGIVSAEDFRQPALANAWLTLGELRSRQRPISLEALANEMANRGRAEIGEVMAAAEEWSIRSERVRSAEDVAHIVTGNARARSIIAAARAVAEYGETEAEDVESLASHAAKSIGDAVVSGTEGGFVQLMDACLAFYDSMEHRAKNRKPGITTGIKPLDDLLCGMEPGVFVLAARTGVGKTSMALNIAAHVAALGRGEVLFFSLEMIPEQLVTRWLSSATGISTSAFRLGNLTDEQLKSTTEHVNKIAALPINISEKTGLTPLALRSQCQLRRAQGEVSLVIVDYLQLLAPDKGRKDSTREREVAEMSRAMKLLSQDLKVPVLLLSQLNRSSEKEDRAPRLSDLRESGAIENDADAVILMSRDTSTNAYHVDLAKHRHGATGAFELLFDGSTTTFRVPAAGEIQSAAPQSAQSQSDGPEDETKAISFAQGS